MVKDEILLEALKIKFSQRFNPETYLMKSMEAKVLDVSSIFADDVYLELTTKILGQKHEQTYLVNVDVPKNWWWHFLRDVFKVKNIKTATVTRKITFDHWNLLPELKINTKQVAYTQINWTQGVTPLETLPHPKTD